PRWPRPEPLAPSVVAAAAELGRRVRAATLAVAVAPDVTAVRAVRAVRAGLARLLPVAAHLHRLAAHDRARHRLDHVVDAVGGHADDRGELGDADRADVPTGETA